MEAKISVLLADASGDLRPLLRETPESTGEFQVVGETGDGAALTPNYLRLSQAERERLEREQQNS